MYVYVVAQINAEYVHVGMYACHRYMNVFGYI